MHIRDRGVEEHTRILIGFKPQITFFYNINFCAKFAGVERAGDDFRRPSVMIVGIWCLMASLKLMQPLALKMGLSDSRHHYTHIIC